MIELHPSLLPSLTPWFPAGSPGIGALAEHVLRTGNGRWWCDRPGNPRILAVSCGDHALLRGDPRGLASEELRPLATHYVHASAGFAASLHTALEGVTPWERMMYVRRAPALPARPPRGVTVRRLLACDARALAALGPQASWIHGTWGGPHGLAGSGAAWGAFHRRELLAVACAYFAGSRYEDVAVLADPGHRRRHLGLACVSALCEDIAARGRTPTWSCARDNRPNRLLAWRAGFRLEHEYVHYATRGPRTPSPPHRAPDPSESR
ncbi:GNAT family N-acetyltransferase [Streptomyces sp. NPDC127051]|uniref:GNAT family N-acetyltransferase n=1 Tax=Streptomyces sp. NPDC127051 TaxID=3347119 RepID=UPI003658220D